jgi:hypothetical protein
MTEARRPLSELRFEAETKQQGNACIVILR